MSGAAAGENGEAMALDGLHHVTAICSDAQTNADWYVGLLGLRLLKRSINQANPDALHLFYGDETGTPGATITFFVHPRLPRGRAGRGQIAKVLWRVGSVGAIEFWEQRFSAAGIETVREDEESVCVADPDGLVHELRLVAGSSEPPLRAAHPEIAPEFALCGLHGVTAYHDLDADGDPLEFTGVDRLLGVTRAGELRGPTRGALYQPVAAPEAPARRGAGVVHHVAWTIPDAAFADWQTQLGEAGVELVEVADRYYFRSLYFRIPDGVLFELATPQPGFTVDEPLATLGTRLCVPPAFADRAAELEASLAPLSDPLAAWRAERAGGG